MNYSELSQGQIFSCKVKATYTEIFVGYGDKGEYHKVFSIQKNDYNNIIGYGEKYATTDNGFTPITLTDETLMFIAYKCGLIDENGNKIGALNADNTALKDMQSYEHTQKNVFAPADNLTTVINPNIKEEEEVLYDNETVKDYLSLLDDTDIVYVKTAAIDCQVVAEDEVEIEDVEIEEEIERKESKDYSKFIWLALGAAALLL